MDVFTLQNVFKLIQIQINQGIHHNSNLKKYLTSLSEIKKRMASFRATCAWDGATQAKSKLKLYLWEIEVQNRIQILKGLENLVQMPNFTCVQLFTMSQWILPIFMSVMPQNHKEHIKNPRQFLHKNTNGHSLLITPQQPIQWRRDKIFTLYTCYISETVSMLIPSHSFQLA